MDKLNEAKVLSEKWVELVEGKTAEGDDLGFEPIKDRTRKHHVAQLLENTESDLREQGRLMENSTGGIDNIDPLLMTLVRRTTPNMLAYDLVGVQPMKGPVGIVFAKRTHYGAQPQGPFGRPGDGRTGFQTGSDLDSQGDTTAQQWGETGKAPNEAFYNEADTTFTGTGTQTPNTSAPNYNAYSVGSGMATTAGETLGRGETGDAEWATISFTIEKTSVEAKTRAIRAEYTVEVAQDLRSVHGLDAESELTNDMSLELLLEQNREIVNTIRKVAKIAPGEVTYLNGSVVRDSNNDPVLGTTGLFDIDANTDGRWQKEKYSALLMKINKEANAIAKDTRRGRGNFVICSSDVASALDLSGKLVYAPAMDNNLNVDDTGNTFVGVLQGKYRVYIDPFLGYDEVIVGYKGPGQMDSGLFFCPYVPLQMYRATNPNTLQPILAFKTRRGLIANPFTTLKANSNSYYRKFKVSNI